MQWLSPIVVVVLLAIHVSSIVINTSVKRTIDLTQHIVQTVDIIAFKDDEREVATYEIVLSLDQSERLSHWNAKGSKNIPLSITKTTTDQVLNVSKYVIELNKPQPKGTEGLIHLVAYFTRVLTPYPISIKQNEDQLVVYKGRHLFLSPYTTEFQQLQVKLPSSQIENYSIWEPVSIQESVLTYGPYENIAPFTALKQPSSLHLHFKHNEPFLTMTNLVKEIEVSMWGRVSVEEVVDLAHTGAKLLGGFSRFDYSVNDAHGSSFRSLSAIMPKDSLNVYYRDQIGNITTSHMTTSVSKTELMMHTRFPLFGGWKTEYYLGYSVPTMSVLHRKNERYRLEMDFSTCVEHAAVDKMTLKVILPEGASNIEVRIPFEIDSESYTTRQSYLDGPDLGRPVVIIQKSNLVPQHNIPFVVYFDYPSLYMYREPAMLIGGYFVFFVICMVIFRMDWSLYQSKSIKDIKTD